MDDIQKEALRRSRVFLVQNLMPDTLWDHLIGNGVFTEMMLEYVKCKQPRSEQIRSLLSDLTRRHYGAYEGFLNCLMETGHEHCAEEIKKNMVKIQVERGQSPIMTETLDPNPASGPTLGPLPQQISNRESGSDVEMEDTIPSSVQQESTSHYGNVLPQNLDYWYHKNKDKEEVYKMESTPRGFVYIINNQNFKHMLKRKGSDKDQEKVEKLFDKLGFKVFFDKDLTAKEMKEKLELFSKFQHLSAVDSCVIVILSHGGTNRIFGIDATTSEGDSNYITDNDLKLIFGNTNCSLLHEKPKLFLIQSCRGTDEDPGIPSLSSQSSTRTMSTSSKDGGNLMTDVNRDPSSMPATTSRLQSTSLPTISDMIIAHSSVDGYVSYRNEEEGSVFIGEVVQVFNDHAHDTHMMDMLTKVNSRVARKFETNAGYKMMPQPTSLLLKKWYLNPINNPVT